MLNFDQAPIGGFLKEKLKDYQPAPVTYEYGTVESCQDGIVRVSGLSHAQYGELLEFENDAYGMNVAEAFTGKPGRFVPLKDTIRSFRAIVDGQVDDLPEQAFFMVGDIDEVIAKAKEMQENG